MRRRGGLSDFLRGFNEGYQAVGGLLAAYEASKLNDEDPYASDDVTKDDKTYQQAMGLQGADQQAAMLREQDAGFGVDAANMTAAGLNYASGDKTPANDHLAPGKWNYLGQQFDAKPTEAQRDWALDRAKAKIYEKYGLMNEARQFRNDARAGRRDDLAMQEAQLRLGGLRRQEELDQMRMADLKAAREANRSPEAFAAYLQNSARLYNTATTGPHADGANIGISNDGKITYVSADGRVSQIPVEEAFNNLRIRNKLLAEARLANAMQYDPNAAQTYLNYARGLDQDAATRDYRNRTLDLQQQQLNESSKYRADDLALRERMRRDAAFRADQQHAIDWFRAVNDNEYKNRYLKAITGSKNKTDFDRKMAILSDPNATGEQIALALGLSALTPKELSELELNHRNMFASRAAVDSAGGDLPPPPSQTMFTPRGGSSTKPTKPAPKISAKELFASLNAAKVDPMSALLDEETVAAYKAQGFDVGGAIDMILAQGGLPAQQKRKLQRLRKKYGN